MQNRLRIKRPVLAVMVALMIVPAIGGCWTSKTLAPAIRYGQLEGANSNGIHTIAAGDTVWNLAERYKLVMRDIIIVNNLSAPYALNVGDRLRLPPPRTYRVRRGDSLYSVSRLFNTSASELARLNDLRAPYALTRGQVIKLSVVDERPAGAAPIATVPAVRAGAVDREVLSPPQPATVSNTTAATAAPEVSGQSVPAPPPQVANASLSAKIPKTTPARAGTKFAWPVQGILLSGYGPKPGGLHNDGINIKAPKGTPVRAAENGVVVYASNMKGYGNMVLVRHADRWMTAYAHLDKIQIERGATIKRGQTIGTVGTTGSVSEPQLHFEIRRGTDALNPRKYM